METALYFEKKLKNVTVRFARFYYVHEIEPEWAIVRDEIQYIKSKIKILKQHITRDGENSDLVKCLSLSIGKDLARLMKTLEKLSNVWMNIKLDTSQKKKKKKRKRKIPPRRMLHLTFCKNELDYHYLPLDVE